MNRPEKDLSPVLVKVGVALALSFASFFFSRVRGKKLKSLPSPPSPSTPCLANGDNLHSQGRTNGLKDEGDEDHQRILTENASADPMNNVVEELDISIPCLVTSPNKLETQLPKSCITMEKDMYEEEIKQLKNMVEELHERESNLEVQLLEYYGLKEQEAASTELQNRLTLNNMESKLLYMKIESLQEHNMNLQQQVADHAQVVADLETARSKIEMLKKKLRSEAEHHREQILYLHKRVEKLQSMERDSEMQANFHKMKQLEDQVEELSKSNMRLQHENSDLVMSLESTQILANCVLEDSQTETLKREREVLQQEKESLTEEVEQLQSNRCSDIEELVYLRWINACLRYELRNYQPAEGKTVARDLSKTLSPKSEEKAKHLILQYATGFDSEVVVPEEMGSFNLDSDQWSSSSNYLTDYSDDYSSFFDNYVSSKTKKKNKLFGKLRKLLILGKDVDEKEYDDDSKSSITTLGLSSSRHSLDIQWPRKDELTKYAKALKGSSLEEGRRKLHRKTPSAGSLHSN